MSSLRQQKNNIARGIVLCLVGTLLAGCSPLQPLKSANISSYALELSFEQAATSMGDATLLVSTPTARPGFDSTRMVYLKRLHEIDYFSQNQWVDTPARMFAPLLVQALESTGQFRAVVPVRSAALADLRMDTEIIRMQHEFLTRPSRVRVTVRAQLIWLKDGRVLATREFDVTEAATSDDPYGGVMATHNAVKNVLLQLAEFFAQASKSAKPEGKPG